MKTQELVRSSTSLGANVVGTADGVTGFSKAAGDRFGTAAAPFDPQWQQDFSTYVAGANVPQFRPLPGSPLRGTARPTQPLDILNVARKAAPDVGAVESAGAVSLTSSAVSGTYLKGQVIDLFVKFNGPVTVTGSPRLRLNSGGTAGYVDGTGTDLLRFRYTVAAGQNAAALDAATPAGLELNGGTVTVPSSGEAVALTLAKAGDPGSLGGSALTIDTRVPAVTAQPQGATVASGMAAGLSVTATGPRLFYQWYRGTSGDTTQPIAGAVNATYLALNNTATTNFWVRISNANGAVNSQTAVVTVPVAPPGITTQPAGVTIPAGQAATLTVVAFGQGVQYQWYRGATGVTTTPVGGATAATLTLPANSPSATYWVRVSNAGGMVDSQAATVTVATAVAPPAVTGQPAAVAVFPNQAATMSVTATGSQLSYQWYRGASGVTTTPVSGATAATLTLAAGTAPASYWARVSNPGGSVNSQAAAVTAKPAPTITAQPAATAVFPGRPATVSVTASGQQVSYQWYRGVVGNTASPVGGATGATLTLPSVTAAATYWARVTNPAGAVNSQAAAVTLAQAPTIAVQPKGTAVFPTQATALSVTATGQQVSYQWYRGPAGNTASPVSGGTGATLTVPAGTAAATYWVRVTNPAGAVNSAAATVGRKPAPTITGQPANRAVPRNTTATLTATAAGEQLTYQWYRGPSGTTSTPIGGATAASYTTPAVTGTTAYWVRVTNPAGVANSQTATVRVA